MTVISNCAYCLIRVPDLVRDGSKPRREIVRDAAARQRPFGEIVDQDLFYAALMGANVLEPAWVEI